MISRRKYMSNLPKIKHHPSKKNRADGIVTPIPDKIVPDGARPKYGWFYLASWTRSLKET